MRSMGLNVLDYVQVMMCDLEMNSSVKASVFLLDMKAGSQGTAMGRGKKCSCLAALYMAMSLLDADLRRSSRARELPRNGGCLGR
jgi:transcription initiation factor TFIIIB Brf1 subunit/transcription initiation factor TFIIB